MSIEQLKKFANLDNIAEELSEDELQEIGRKCLQGFKEDEDSSQSWINDVRRVVELSSLKSHKKTYPLPTSANVKYPLITKAAYEFASRTYPEIIKDGKVVKAHIIGEDDLMNTKQLQASRVTEYMNYQLMFQNNNWELELDRLLNTIALIGFVCKKTYYEPIRKQIKSEICEFEDLIINAEVRNLDDAQRINHVLHLSSNDLLEHCHAGLFLEECVYEELDKRSNQDLEKPFDLVEQHTYLDLDNDRYKEPYIVTFFKDTGEVLRIAPRFNEDGIQEINGKIKYIDAIQYFTDFHFLVSPQGKFQSVGFGILMLHLNESINTLLNQLIDSGQLANLKAGYVDSSYKMIQTGEANLDPGEFQKVKVAPGKLLKEGIFQLQYGEPSSVLFQLLALLIKASQELSSSTEVMAGSSSTENAKTGAIQALIQQSMTVFNAIQRRIYRSLTNEYRKVFKLNGLYMDPTVFIQIVNQNLHIARSDFDPNKVSIIPVADPNLSSDIKRAARAQFLAGLRGSAGLNEIQVTKQLLEAGDIPNPEVLMLPPQQMNQPNPESLKIQAEIQADGERLELEGRKQALAEKQFTLEVLKTESIILLNKANAMKSIAQADQAQSLAQTKEFELQLNTLQTHLDSLLDFNKLKLDAQMHNDQMQQQQDQQDQQEDQNNAEGNNQGMDGSSGQ